MALHVLGHCLSHEPRLSHCTLRVQVALVSWRLIFSWLLTFANYPTILITCFAQNCATAFPDCWSERRETGVYDGYPRQRGGTGMQWRKHGHQESWLGKQEVTSRTETIDLANFYGYIFCAALDWRDYLPDRQPRAAAWMECEAECE